MKIYFDNVDFSSNSGPNSAVRKIAKQLVLRGHTIADYDDYNVALVTIEPTAKLNKRKPYVQRLDGIWFKPEEFHHKNTGIRKCYESATAIVFQSQFSKNMVTKWFGEPNGVSAVVHNGVELKKIECVIPELHEIRKKYEKVFVCSASWHPQKRLKDNVGLFKHLRNKTYHNSCLIVLGRNPDYVVPDANIFYTNDQPEKVCLQVYAAADWLIHLSWAENCSNVTMQSISQNTPVVYSETGGSSEFVGSNGVMLRESVKYEFELFDYDKPPQLDVTQIESLPDIKKTDPSNLDIKLAAQKYEEIFERCL